MQVKNGRILVVIIILSILLASCDAAEQIQSSDALPTENQISQTSNEDTTTENEDKSVEGESIDGEEEVGGTMKLKIGEETFNVTLADNSSAEALMEMLLNGPISIDMRDYASMEKVGSLATALPRNDEQITAEPGDLILYQGDSLVIYYEPNSWNFTRIGKIDNITTEELKDALGTGDVIVTLSQD
jgi:hypothetical protein